MSLLAATQWSRNWGWQGSGKKVAIHGNSFEIWTDDSGRA